MDVDVSGVEGPVTGGQSCHGSPAIQNQELSSAARLAGLPERDFFLAGGATWRGAAGIAGIPGGMAIPGGIPPPFRICFIIFCAAENLSTRAFTS